MVGREKGKYITVCTAQMHRDFKNIMRQLGKEARAGALATKWQAVHRRDTLMGKHTPLQAMNLAEAAANGCYVTDT